VTTKDDDTRDESDDDDAKPSKDDGGKGAKPSKGEDADDDVVDDDDDEEDDDAEDAKPSKDDDDDDDADDEPKAAAKRREPEAKPKKPAPASTKKSSERPKPRRAGSPARVVGAAPGSSGASRAILLALVGVAIGVAGGWFLRDAKAKGRAPFKSAAAPASSGVSGECKTWQDKICGEAGAESAGCVQARAAAELIPNAACGAALEDVPTTLARLKAARESCTELVTKLCTELGNGTETCKMVRTKTERMAPENCKSMLENYPQVIAQLKMMQEQGGMMGGGRPMGGRPMPPGMPARPPEPAPAPH